MNTEVQAEGMVNQQRESLRPLERGDQTARHQLDLKREFALTLLPTPTVLAVFALVEVSANNVCYLCR